MLFTLIFSIFTIGLLINVTTATKSITNPKLSNQNQRLFGGNLAESDQFPYHVGLSVIDLYVQCDGVLISPNWVLTGVSCVSNWHPSYIKIFVGSNRFHNSNNGQSYNIDEIIRHPEYVTYGLHDVALVKPTVSILLSEFVQPIRFIDIDSFDTIGAGVSSTVTGWSPSTSDQTLTYLNMVTLTNIDCESRLAGRYQWAIHTSTICAYSNEIGRGLYFTNVGSPLVTDNGELIGFALVASGAQGRPDIFQRFSYYSSWIFENINDN